MNASFDTFSTAFGRFSLATDERGAVIAAVFGDRGMLQQRAAYPDLRHNAAACRRAREQVEAYCLGELREFTVPLAPRGTRFQHQVWDALRLVPFGETRSYGQLAAALGHPAASRAVGRANALNPICLLIPCHRVIGADGSLTGFAFGEDLKRRLLAHERAGTATLRAA